MEFHDVNFSYIDNETFEEQYLSAPEQSSGKLIPDGICNPGQVIYTVSPGKSGMIGAFWLESQMFPGNGKFARTSLGSDGKSKEYANTAFNYLKANAKRISGSISTTTKDYIVNYQDLQGIGMTERLALPALTSIALGKPALGSMVVVHGKSALPEQCSKRTSLPIPYRSVRTAARNVCCFRLHPRATLALLRRT